MCSFYETVSTVQEATNRGGNVKVQTDVSAGDRSYTRLVTSDSAGRQVAVDVNLAGAVALRDALNATIAGANAVESLQNEVAPKASDVEAIQALGSENLFSQVEFESEYAPPYARVTFAREEREPVPAGLCR